jgi:hypothetical protein
VRGNDGSITSIVVRNATEHNLKNISVEIPRDKMTICSGPSGSGKSSLAMDTVYAEGQRRYVESLSSYARQFIGQLQKPHVEHIEGLSPAIAIEQKAASHSPRSTVGTITEIQDYMRVLFARLGTPYCPECGIPVSTQTLDDIVAKIVTTYGGGTRPPGGCVGDSRLEPPVRSTARCRPAVGNLPSGENVVPSLDIPTAKKIYETVHTAIMRGLLRSVHDLSEGGLAVAVAEMCIAGGFGAKLTGEFDVITLFSESNSRFVIEVEPAHTAEVESLFKGLPIRKLGEVTAEKVLTFGESFSANVDELKAAWQKPLDL